MPKIHEAQGPEAERSLQLRVAELGTAAVPGQVTIGKHELPQGNVAGQGDFSHFAGADPHVPRHSSPDRTGSQGDFGAYAAQNVPTGSRKQ